MKLWKVDIVLAGRTGTLEKRDRALQKLIKGLLLPSG